MPEVGFMEMLYLAGAFLLGSIPFGLLFTRASGVDITKVGSGNIGATNVMRTVGKVPAVMTLLFDLLKGSAAVATGIWLELGPLLPGAMGLAAVLGHDFSVFRGFRGGKGVATSIGVLLVFMPAAGLATVVVWLFAIFITRVSALGALCSFAVLPLAVWLLDYGWEKLFLSVIITVLLYIRHVSNIRQLIEKKKETMGGKD